jgi:hypothetical protein
MLKKEKIYAIYYSRCTCSFGAMIGNAKNSVIEYVYEIGNKISDIWHMIQNFFNAKGF